MAASSSRARKTTLANGRKCASVAKPSGFINSFEIVGTRVNGNFTLMQKAAIIDYSSKNHHHTLNELTIWSKNKFKLKIVPTRFCIHKILRNQDSIPSIEDINKGEEEKRSTKSASLSELDDYLYSVVTDHEKANVAITGPVFRWLAKKYCTTVLHLPDAQCPEISNGWFSRFKKRYNLHGYKMHGETRSLVNIDQDAIKEKINQVKEKIRGYDPKDIFNFDETALYYARSLTKTISSEPVSGVKVDKKILIAGLLCSSYGKFRRTL